MLPRYRKIRNELSEIEEIELEIQGRKDCYYDLALLPNADIEQIKNDLKNDDIIKQLQEQLDLLLQNRKPNCNLTTCRYNANGRCENEEKRKECVEVSRKVLCLEENENENDN